MVVLPHMFLVAGMWYGSMNAEIVVGNDIDVIAREIGHHFTHWIVFEMIPPPMGLKVRGIPQELFIKLS